MTGDPGADDTAFDAEAIEAARKLFKPADRNRYFYRYNAEGLLRADSIARAARLNAALVEDALARGGTCTGEHGIGFGKLDYLAREHGDLVPLLRGIKQLFDPNGILNPGKAVPG